MKNLHAIINILLHVGVILMNIKKIALIFVIICILIPTHCTRYSYKTFHWINLGNGFYNIQRIYFLNDLILTSYNTNIEIDVSLCDNGIISTQISEHIGGENILWYENYSIEETRWLDELERIKFGGGNSRTQYFSLTNLNTCDSCRSDFELMIDLLDCIDKTKRKQDKEDNGESVLKL